MLVALLVVSLLGGARYVVVRGDTYATIAERFHVDEKVLKNANPGVRLKPGTVLIIPEIPTPPPWSPATPYRPPVPTVSELNAAIEREEVIATEDPKRRGYFRLFAGLDGTDPIGEARPAGRRGGHIYFLAPGVGGSARRGKAFKLGRTDALRDVPSCASCEELLLGPQFDPSKACPH